MQFILVDAKPIVVSGTVTSACYKKSDFAMI